MRIPRTRSELWAKKLKEYGAADGTDLGKACELLSQLHEYTNYLGFSFQKALLDEVRYHLERFSTDEFHEKERERLDRKAEEFAKSSERKWWHMN